MPTPSEILSSNAVKIKDSSIQTITAESVGTKLSEYDGGSTHNSEPMGILHDSLISEHGTDRVHGIKGVSAESNSFEESRKVAVFMMAEINKEQLRLAILLVMLGASIVIFCLGIIMLIVYSFHL